MKPGSVAQVMKYGLSQKRDIGYVITAIKAVGITINPNVITYSQSMRP
jgi:hypothetical protein